MKTGLIPISLSLLLLAGCSASKISFNVLAPAPVEISRDIKTVAIIDRSIPADEDINLIEGILTIEGKKQDEVASQIVIDGLNQRLSESDRFNIIRTNEAIKGSGTGFMFPEPLNWDEVDKLSSKYEADAILSLETFDSDFLITRGAIPGKNLMEIHAGGVAKINCGFRIYYPAGRAIVDEFLFTRSYEWESGGLSVLAAANAITARNNAIKDASFTAGVVYGERITPSWYRVSRDYFTKAKKNPYMEEGARMMQLNEWDNAIAALEKGIDSGDTKSKGRSAHNLAVVYEILGDLNAAKEWATLAWGKYREKVSREYGIIINRRIREQEAMQY